MTPAAAQLGRPGQVAEREGVPADQGAERPQQGAGVLAVAGFAGEGLESQEAQCSHAGARRSGVVHELAWSGDQGVRVVAGGEHSTRGIPEQVHDRIRGLGGELDPTGPPGRGVQRQERLDEGTVVGCVGEVAGPTVGLPGPQPPTVGSSEVAHQELGRPRRLVDPVRPPQSGARLGRAR